MGNEKSTPIELCTNFDTDEIRRLGKRFRQLELDGQGTLDSRELLSESDLEDNPFSKRVLSLFDPEGTGEVDFKEFIQGISQFSVKGDRLSKLRFAFRLYDLNNTNYITNAELFQVLKIFVGDNLEDTQIQHMVDHTMINAGKDEEGNINFEEFCDMVLKPTK